MNECSLCGRDISSKDNRFGLVCLNKMCNIVGIKKVSNLKKEKYLDFKIQLLNWKFFLNKEHKQLLTNRYLTYRILSKIDIDTYKEQANTVKKDVKKITNKTKNEELESNGIMTIKQAFETLEMYNEFLQIKRKIESKEVNSDDIQNFLFDNLLFVFSTYYNNKKYLGGLLAYIQKFFWNAIILKQKGEYPTAMDLLKHSLQDNPSNMFITEGTIVEQIKKDENFIGKIDEILNNNLNKNSFEEITVLNYKDSDLTAGLNNTTISIIGTKIEEKWKLDITITDRYDFTDFKELDEYKDSKVLSIANNCAMVSVESGVIKEYDIKIQFNIVK